MTELTIEIKVDDSARIELQTLSALEQIMFNAIKFNELTPEETGRIATWFHSKYTSPQNKGGR